MTKIYTSTEAVRIYTSTEAVGAAWIYKSDCAINPYYRIDDYFEAVLAGELVSIKGGGEGGEEEDG